MKNNQKGITLVALVITIIVLLILAGVTIAALSGENGILTRSSQSAKETKVGNAKEIVTNAYNAAVAEYYNARYVNAETISDAAAYVKGKMATDTDITSATSPAISAASSGKAFEFTIDGVKYTGTIANVTGGKGTTLTWSEANV